MTYNTKTYKSNNKEVQTYLIDNDIWLSQKEIAVLFNTNTKKISRLVVIISKEKQEIFSKMRLSSITRPIDIYSSKTVIEIGKLLGSFDVLDFESWVNQTLINQNNSNYQIVRYNQENIDIDVIVDPINKTIWLTQESLTILFETSLPNISYHISNIIKDQEVDLGATLKEILIVQQEGDRSITRLISHYNLEMVISLGFRINSKKAIEFRRWANNVLRRFIVNGYVDNNSTLVSYDNRINQLSYFLNDIREDVDLLNQRMDKLEKENREGIIIDKYIYEDQLFEANVLISKLLLKAESSIVLIDPYIDITTLDIFKNKRKEIPLRIITSSKSKISKREMELFKEKYGELYIYLIDIYHDRYLIIDSHIFYHIGASINYLGKRFSQISKIEDEDMQNILRRRIDNLISICP